MGFCVRNTARYYGGCSCPPRPPQPPRCPCNPCPCQPCRPICPPADCSSRPIPPNPCCPRYPGKGVWRKYRNMFFFLCVPLLILQTFHAFGHEPHHKGECRDYEYMRRRTKRFPWGRRGIKSLFHNPCTNHLPGECEPPPVECD